MSLATVVIIGRPNVGKSTLFNRLAGRAHALVEDTPGVTRDWREGEGSISSLKFRLIDTAGLEDAFDDSLEARMLAHTEYAVAQASVILFVIDGRAGITPLDKHFAKWLRPRHKQVVVVINKCEGRQGGETVHDSYRLGFGEPVGISAAHGEGLADLYNVLAPHLEGHQDEEESADAPLHLAIVGRPNAGKSTLLNQLLQSDRAVTGPEAGITRDAIVCEWEWQGRRVRLIDTAGMRRKSSVQDPLEKLSLSQTLHAMRHAQVVILMVDALLGMESQDTAIAELIIREGRAVVIALNKWDQVEDKAARKRDLEYHIEHQLHAIKGVPIICISALKATQLDALMRACMEVYQQWNIRIPTAKLNEWLAQALEHHLLPLGSRGKRVRIKYVTQYKTRPPTFSLFCSSADDIPESYRRYLMHSLRDTFNLAGVPLRLSFRQSDNPFAGKK